MLLWLFDVKFAQISIFFCLNTILYKRFVQILDHIAGEHAECAEFFARDAACFLVQKCAEYGCFGSRQTLCEERDDNSRKHISAPAFSHSRICNRNDIDIPVWRGDICWCAF